MGTNTNLNSSVPGSWLYLMNTSTDWSRTKIGMTRNNPMVRFAQLRCGDPNLCLHVAFFIPSACQFNAGYFEARLHAQFDPIRLEFHNGGRSEWFADNCKYFESQAEQFIENQFEDQSWLVAGFSDDAFFSGQLVVKLYESDLIRLFGPPAQLDEDGFPWG